jgi:hypothetical protein
MPQDYAHFHDNFEKKMYIYFEVNKDSILHSANGTYNNLK